MCAMRIIKTTATQWGLQLPLRALLRTAGGNSAPKQANGIGATGCDWPMQRSANPPSRAQPSGARHGGIEVMETVCN